MLGRLVAFISRKRHAQNERLAGAILERLAVNPVLTIDKYVLRALAASRRRLLRVVCELVLREKVYMIADVEGVVVVMSNAEYSRYMTRRTSRETEIRRRDDVSVRASRDAGGVRLYDAIARNAGYADTSALEAVRQEALDAAAAAILTTDTDSALFTGATLGGGTLDGLLSVAESVDAVQRDGGAAGDGGAESRRASELEWFQLEVSSGGRAKVPDARQTLPERRREPWTVLEGASRDAY